MCTICIEQRNKNEFTEDTHFGLESLGVQEVDSDKEDSSMHMELAELQSLSTSETLTWFQPLAINLHSSLLLIVTIISIAIITEVNIYNIDITVNPNVPKKILRLAEIIS